MGCVFFLVKENMWSLKEAFSESKRKWRKVLCDEIKIKNLPFMFPAIANQRKMRKSVEKDEDEEKGLLVFGLRLSFCFVFCSQRNSSRTKEGRENKIMIPKFLGKNAKFEIKSKRF